MKSSILILIYVLLLDRAVTVVKVTYVNVSFSAYDTTVPCSDFAINRSISSKHDSIRATQPRPFFLSKPLLVSFSLLLNCLLEEEPMMMIGKPATVKGIPTTTTVLYATTELGQTTNRYRTECCLFAVLKWTTPIRPFYPTTPGKQVRRQHSKPPAKKKLLRPH